MESTRWFVALGLISLFCAGCGSDDGPPSSWEAELSEALTPEVLGPGTLNIIAWEERESEVQGKIFHTDSALVVEEMDDPKHGFYYALMMRRPSSSAEILRDWHVSGIHFSGVPPNAGFYQSLVYRSEERPDNKEIYEKFWIWRFSDREFVSNPDGPGSIIVPRDDLVRGGVNRLAWRRATGEEPERFYSDPPVPQ